MLYVVIAIAALAVGIILGAPLTAQLLLRWERGRRELPPEATPKPIAALAERRSRRPRLKP